MLCYTCFSLAPVWSHCYLWVMQGCSVKASTLLTLMSPTVVLCYWKHGDKISANNTQTVSVRLITPPPPAKKTLTKDQFLEPDVCHVWYFTCFLRWKTDSDWGWAQMCTCLWTRINGKGNTVSSCLFQPYLSCLWLWFDNSTVFMCPAAFTVQSPLSFIQVELTVEFYD